MFKFFLIFLFLNINIVLAKNIDKDTIDIYIRKANNIKLYENIKWLSLIHYKKTVGGKYESIIDNKDFFLSDNGKCEPKSELEATIKAFFNSDNEETEMKQHAICQFPARFEFLNKYLQFPKNLLPAVDCKRFNKFFSDVNPEGLTIIFPTTYINNPASMFGHTLIRIDKKNSYKLNTHLDSIIINYGANTYGETSGIIYAFKGIFGLYDGFFSATEYYKMTNNYSNLENRDIWEYRLNFNQKEAEFYTKHIWELIYSKSNYYFFKRNCSYLILDTLNVLRPELNLTNDFLIYTAPIDTIRVLKEKDIIVDSNYRASLQKQIQINETILNKKEIKTVKNIVKNETYNPTIDINNNIIYETVYKLLQYKKLRNEIDLSFYRRQSIKVLKNINNYDKSEYVEYKKQISPDNGHFLKRIAVYSGHDHLKQNFFEISFKPVYHELVDNNDGFEPNSEISFFDTSIRYYFDNNKIDLEKLDFIKIKSFTTHDNFFKPLSFSVLFGINNIYDDYKVLIIDTNGGITLGNDEFSIHFLVGPKINYTGNFQNNFEFGVNAIAGLFLNFNKFKIIFDYKINKFLQSKYNYDQLNIDINIIYHRNYNLNIKYGYLDYNSFKSNNILMFGFKYFFY